MKKYFTQMKIISLWILFVLNVLPSTSLFSQYCDERINVHPISLQSNRATDLDFLDSTVVDRNFFFFSEAHGNPYTFEIAQKLITYLASHDKLDWVAIESDYAHGYELNQYMETGDSSVLRDFLDHQTDFAAYENLDYFSHYHQLKILYDSLDVKFRFVGIDVCKEGFKGSAFSLLKLLSALNYSAEFKSIISEGNELLRKKEISYRKMQKWIETIRSQHIQIRQAFVVKSEPHKFEHLERIIFNVQQSIEIRSRKPVNREAEIAHNFQRYMDHKEDVYCQFGYGHVLTNRWPENGDSGKSFVDWLEATNNYKARAVIFALSPTLDDSPEFALFGNPLCTNHKSEIIEKGFPAIVDFRNVSAFNDQFQFAFILSK